MKKIFIISILIYSISFGLMAQEEKKRNFTYNPNGEIVCNNLISYKKDSYKLTIGKPKNINNVEERLITGYNDKGDVTVKGIICLLKSNDINLAKNYMGVLDKAINANDSSTTKSYEAYFNLSSSKSEDIICNSIFFYPYGDNEIYYWKELTFQRKEKTKIVSNKDSSIVTTYWEKSEKFPEGNMHEKYISKKGSKVGKDVAYAKDGKTVIGLAFYKDGVIVGDLMNIHLDGTKVIKTFENGKVIKETSYYKDGTSIHTLEIKKQRKGDSEYFTYFKNGQTSSHNISDVDSGSENTEYYENGKIKVTKISKPMSAAYTVETETIGYYENGVVAVIETKLHKVIGNSDSILVKKFYDITGKEKQ